MTKRLGMDGLIEQLRQMTDADRQEFTLAGRTYWEDQHLQDILDMHRLDVYRETIYPVATYDSANSLKYYDYYWTVSNDVEEAASGTSCWMLQNQNGSVVGTANYSVDYNNKHIHFNTATLGDPYVLTYRAFDLNKAAVDVWMKKAATVASRFDISTDNHNLTRSQLKKHYIEMANEYRRASGGTFKIMRRQDLNVR